MPSTRSALPVNAAEAAEALEAAEAAEVSAEQFEHSIDFTGSTRYPSRQYADEEDDEDDDDDDAPCIQPGGADQAAVGGIELGSPRWSETHPRRR